MNETLRNVVWRRADSRCEYCRMHQDCDPLNFEVEHVIPQKHGGPSVEDNLALACFACNRHKGPNLAGLDPQNGSLTRLFDPRKDVWRAHFRWAGARLAGISDVGRTTIDVLNINAPHRLAHREALIEEGVFPPE